MSARMIIARLRSQGRDAGITLAELIVALGLSTLIGAMTLGLFLSINTSSANTIDRTINSSTARATIQAWTAYIRVSDGTTAGMKANRIEWLTAKDMLFYADINNRSIDTVSTTGAPTMVWLRLDASGTLVEEQFPSTATMGTAPTVCRTLVHNVSQPPVTTTNPTGALFSGWDTDGKLLSNLGTAPGATTGCRSLPVTVPSQTKQSGSAQTNLQNVSTTKIDFVVRDTKSGHPLEFTSVAVLPALGGF
jgi:hypothetical protein